MTGACKNGAVRIAGAMAAGLMAGGLALTPVQAADLAGDCCTDLEQRIAELETTTVRKGTRVMSVRLSGQIHRSVMWWDDGDESNIYVVDNDYAASKFAIDGEAHAGPCWKIGFTLEWEQADDASNAVTAVSDDAPSTLTESQAVWWIVSDRLGELTVGGVDSASTGASEENLSGAADFAGNSIQSNNAAFALVIGSTARSALTWADVSPDNLSGLDTQDGVRYDSPALGSFFLSAGWYEDDMWDVALHFTRQWNSIQFTAAVGYAIDREGTGVPSCAASAGNPANGGGNTADCHLLSASASVRHKPSGLFATIAAGRAVDDNRQTFAVLNGVNAGVSVDDDASHLYANAGVYRRFNRHGNTSLGVEFYNGECGFGSCVGNFGAAVDGAGFVSGTQVDMIGAWISQEIDAAATTFYLDCHHFEAAVDYMNAAGATVAGPAYRDMHVIKAGAIVHF